MKLVREKYIYFAIPALIMIFIFFVLPNILNFYYSFTDWGPTTPEANFVGISNFIEMFQGNRILKDIWITFKYAFFVSIFMNVGGLALALALEKNTRLNYFFRTLFFIPMLISTLAAGYIFKAIYLPGGPINYFLSLLTGREINFAYLGSVKYTIIFVAVVHAWRWLGLDMLVYFAGLKSIPNELIEASKIEGANYWQTFKNIKFPLLGPAITFCVATALIGSLSHLDVILAITLGGPGGATEVLNLYIYKAFGYGNWGLTIAISLVLFLVVCIVAFPLILFLRRREVEL